MKGVLTKLLFLTVGELGERDAKTLFPHGWGAGVKGVLIKLLFLMGGERGKGAIFSPTNNPLLHFSHQINP